jgi:hypothetical protein
MTVFLVLCYWGRTGLDEHTFGTLKKWCTGTHICQCVCIARGISWKWSAGDSRGGVCPKRDFIIAKSGAFGA